MGGRWTQGRISKEWKDNNAEERRHTHRERNAAVGDLGIILLLLSPDEETKARKMIYKSISRHPIFRGDQQGSCSGQHLLRASENKAHQSSEIDQMIERYTVQKERGRERTKTRSDESVWPVILVGGRLGLLKDKRAVAPCWTLLLELAWRQICSCGREAP